MDFDVSVHGTFNPLLLCDEGRGERKSLNLKLKKRREEGKEG